MTSCWPLQREVVLQRQAMNSQAPTFEPGTDYIATFLNAPTAPQQPPHLPPQPRPQLPPEPPGECLVSCGLGRCAGLQLPTPGAHCQHRMRAVVAVLRTFCECPPPALLQGLITILRARHSQPLNQLLLTSPPPVHPRITIAQVTPGTTCSIRLAGCQAQTRSRRVMRCCVMCSGRPASTQAWR